MQHKAIMAGWSLWLLIAAASLQGSTAATVEVCPAADYKQVPMFSAKVEVFDPINWSMDERFAYAKEHVLMPDIPLIVVFGLCALTLLLFLFWRLFRCMCVVCCQQQPSGDHTRILLGRKLKTLKILVVLFSFSAMGLAAWGMWMVPKEIVKDFWSQLDSVKGFANLVSFQVDGLTDQVSDMTIPLNKLQAIVDTNVNITSLRQDLTAIGSFLDNAPTPTLFLSDLTAVDTSVQGSVKPVLASLTVLLSANVSVSPLSKLQDAVGTVVGGSASGGKLGFNALMTNMTTGSNDYKNALADVTNNLPTSPTPAASDPAITALVTAQARFTPTFWDTSVSAISAALLTIGGMQGGATVNPFSMLIGNVTALQGTSNSLRNSQLPALSGRLQTLNSLYTATIGNFTHLVDRLQHVNSTVIQLPEAAANGTALLSDATSSLQALYLGSPSPLSLPDTLALLGNQLASPGDTSDLTGNATSAQDQLNQAPDPTAFNNYLTTLASIIQATVTPSQQVKVALDAFVAAAPGSAAANTAYSTLRTRVSNAQPPVTNLATAASNGPGPAGTSMISSLSTVQDSMVAFAPALESQRGVVVTASAEVSLYPNTSSYQAALVVMNGTFAALPSPPSQVTSSMVSLLNSIDQITGQQMVSVKAQISTTSSSIKEGASTIRTTVVGNIDSFKQSAEPMAAKGQEYGYLGLMVAYGIICLWLLVLMAFVLLNCPAGVCITALLLALCLTIFLLLPVLYTAGLLVTKDACEHVEDVALGLITDHNSTAYTIANYYLFDQGGYSLRDLLKRANVVDVDAVQADVNRTVNGVLEDLQRQFVLRQQDAVNRVGNISSSLDSLLTVLDYDLVNPIYRQLKSFACCQVADVVYHQWITTLGAGVLAWLALVCGLLVLKQLDQLADGCCGCMRFKASDYRISTKQPFRPIERFGSLDRPLGTMDSLDQATMVHIAIGGAGKGGKGGGNAGEKYAAPMYPPMPEQPPARNSGASPYQYQQAAMLPPQPMGVQSSAASAPVMPSVRMYGGVASSDSPPNYYYPPLSAQPAAPNTGAIFGRQSAVSERSRVDPSAPPAQLF